MFKSSYQTGIFVPLIDCSGSGPNPFYKNWKVKGCVTKGYDTTAKSYTYRFEGPKAPQVSLPKDDFSGGQSVSTGNNGLFLVQPIIAFQMWLTQCPQLHVEVVISDQNGNRRRLFFSDGIRQLHVTQLHSRIPLPIDGVQFKGRWMNLCLDIHGFFQYCYPNLNYRCIHSFSFSGYFRLKRMYTLKHVPVAKGAYVMEPIYPGATDLSKCKHIQCKLLEFAPGITGENFTVTPPRSVPTNSQYLFGGDITHFQSVYMSDGEYGNGIISDKDYQSGQKNNKFRHDEASLSPNQSQISIPQHDSRLLQQQQQSLNKISQSNQINYSQKYQLPKIQKRAFDKSARKQYASKNDQYATSPNQQSLSPPVMLQGRKKSQKNAPTKFVLNSNMTGFSQQSIGKNQNASSINKQSQNAYGEGSILATGGAYPQFKKNNSTVIQKKKNVLQKKNRISINPSSAQSKGTEQGFSSSTNLDVTLRGLKKQIHNNGSNNFQLSQRFAKSIRGGTQSATQYRKNDPYQSHHIQNTSMILSTQNGSFQKKQKGMSRDSNAGDLQSNYKLPPLDSRGNDTDSIKEELYRNNTTIQSSQNQFNKIGLENIHKKKKLKEESEKESKNSTPIQRIGSYQKVKKNPFRTPIIDEQFKDSVQGNLSVTPLKLKYRSNNKKKANKSSRIFQQGKDFDSDSQQSFTYLSQYQQQQTKEREGQYNAPFAASPTKMQRGKPAVLSPGRNLRNMKREFSQILERGEEFQVRKSQGSLKSTTPIGQRKKPKNHHQIDQANKAIEEQQSKRIDRKNRPKRNPLSSKIFKSQQKKLQDQIDQQRRKASSNRQLQAQQLMQQKLKVRSQANSKSPYSKSQVPQRKQQQLQQQKSKYDSRGHRIVQPTTATKEKDKIYTSKTSQVNLKPWSEVEQDEIQLKNINGNKKNNRNYNPTQRHHSEDPKPPNAMTKQSSIRMERKESHAHDSLSPNTNNNFEEQSADSRFNTHTFYMYKQRIEAVRTKQQNNNSVGQNLSTVGLGIISGPELSYLQQDGADSQIEQEINIPDQNINEIGKKNEKLLKPPGEFDRKKLKLSTLRSSSPQIPQQNINDNINQPNAQAMITGKNFGQSTFYQVERNQFDRPYSPPFAGASPGPNLNSSQVLKNKLEHKERRLNRKQSPKSQFASVGSLEKVQEKQSKDKRGGVYFEQVPINKYNKSQLSPLQESQKEPGIESVSSDLLKKADELLGVKFDYRNQCYIDEGTNKVYRLF